VGDLGYWIEAEIWMQLDLGFQSAMTYPEALVIVPNFCPLKVSETPCEIAHYFSPDMGYRRYLADSLEKLVDQVIHFGIGLFVVGHPYPVQCLPVNEHVVATVFHAWLEIGGRSYPPLKMNYQSQGMLLQGLLWPRFPDPPGQPGSSVPYDLKRAGSLPFPLVIPLKHCHVQGQKPFLRKISLA